MDCDATTHLIRWVDVVDGDGDDVDEDDLHDALSVGDDGGFKLPQPEEADPWLNKSTRREGVLCSDALAEKCD